MTEALKDRSMVLQKDMIAEHFARLERAPETGEPVVYTFVPGNLVELIRSFGALPVLPEINALQSGMRKLSGDYIMEAERSGHSEVRQVVDQESDPLFHKNFTPSRYSWNHLVGQGYYLAIDTSA